jgi:hypothetical protein
MRTALRVTLPVLLLLAACGQPKIDTRIPPVPRTTLSPEPKPFNDRVTVTLTADIPSTVYVTTDGTDPKVEGPNRKSGPSPLGLELAATTQLRYYAVSDEDALEETPGTALYTRAGGAPGSVSGEVVFATVAVGKAVAVSLDGAAPVVLGTPTEAGSLPFAFDGVEAGTHRLRAWADRDGNGSFVPVLDLASPQASVELDLEDPFKASAEGVKLYLAASESGLCTLTGTVTFSRPPVGQSLSIAAVSPSALGNNADAASLLAQLQNGYQVFTNDTDVAYPYVLTNLEPGSYVPLAILTGLGAGGAALNFQGNPLQSVDCDAGATQVRNFTFGGVSLSGAASYTPATPPTGLTYGVIAARSVSTQPGNFGAVQAVMMPTVFTQGATAGTLAGGFGAVCLKENANWSMRAFPSTDATNPLVASLQWIVQVLGGPAPHATFTTQSADVQKDFSF